MKLSEEEQKSLQRRCEEYVRVDRGISENFTFYFTNNSVTQPWFKKNCHIVYAYFLNENNKLRGQVKVKIYKDGQEPLIIMFDEPKRWN